MLGSQGEFNFFKYGIFDTEKYNLWTPYLATGLGGVFYYSYLGSYLDNGIEKYENVPEYIKYYDYKNSKTGVSFYVNMSFGIKVSISKRSRIALQLAYYYIHSDKFDWLDMGSRNDYLQEFQVSYTYIW